MMRTLALTVAYDGTDWAGFQRQSRLPTVQSALEAALADVMQHEVTLAAAGRTDAGVHALGQVVSITTANPIPVERIPGAVNRLLPASILVRRAEEWPMGFHARRTARYRRYWYVLQPTGNRDPIRGRFCWQIGTPLNLTAMQAALEPLRGRRDFAVFCHGGEARTTVRRLQRVAVRRWRGAVIVDVQADAFLHQMVRLLVGNLVLVGSGERPANWLEELVQSRNRHLAGKGAPANGLFLMRIGYPPNEISARMTAGAGE